MKTYILNDEAVLTQRHKSKIEDFLLVVVVQKKTLLIKEGKAGDKRKVGEKGDARIFIDFGVSLEISRMFIPG
jgi:hypothetical protein